MPQIYDITCKKQGCVQCHPMRTNVTAENTAEALETARVLLDLQRYKEVDGEIGITKENYEVTAIPRKQTALQTTTEPEPVEVPDTNTDEDAPSYFPAPKEPIPKLSERFGGLTNPLPQSEDSEEA